MIAVKAGGHLLRNRDRSMGAGPITAIPRGGIRQRCFRIVMQPQEWTAFMHRSVGHGRFHGGGINEILLAFCLVFFLLTHLVIPIPSKRHRGKQSLESGGFPAY